MGLRGIATARASVRRDRGHGDGRGGTSHSTITGRDKAVLDRAVSRFERDTITAA